MSTSSKSIHLAVTLVAGATLVATVGVSGTVASHSVQQECAIDRVDVVDPSGTGPPFDEDGDGYASQFGFSIHLDTQCFGAYDGGTFGDGQVEPVLQVYLNDVLLGAIRDLSEYSSSSTEISDDLDVEFAADPDFLEGNFSRGTLSFRLVLLDNDPPLASLDPLSTDTIDEWRGSVNYEPRDEDRPVRTETPSPEPVETETPTETPARTDVDARIVEFDPANGSYSVGDEVVSRVEVENTGDTFDTFFVGYGVRGPDGETYDNNGTTGKPISLGPGDSMTVNLSWTVESDAPPGDYGVGAAVWLEADRDELSTRLDETEVADAFTVVSDAGATSQRALEIDVEPTVRDRNVTLDFEVNNTANRRIDGVTLAVEGVPTEWTVTNRSDDGGLWAAQNRTWFWQSIDAEEERASSITFRLPPNASVGNHTAVARVTDATGTDVTTTVRLSLGEVAAPLSVAVDDAESNRTVAPGSNITVTLGVQNANATRATGVTLELGGSVAKWRVLSHDETGATWSTSTRTWFWRALPANTTETVSVTFGVPANVSTGDHVLEARLSDAAGRGDAVNVSVQVINASESETLTTVRRRAVALRPFGSTWGGQWSRVGDSYTPAPPVSGHGRAVDRER